MGSYGALAITQAVSVVSGDDALAAIGAASGGVGVTVNAGPNDVVVLEGLFIDGNGVGQDGIDYNSGKSLTIQNCHIRNLVSTGIAITSNTAMLTFAIVNTEVAGAAAAAITTQGSAASAGTIATAFLHNNNTGIYAGNTNISIYPIENAFAKLKSLLRKAAERTVGALWDRIGISLDAFTPAECANCFAAAGYDAT